MNSLILPLVSLTVPALIVWELSPILKTALTIAQYLR